MNYIVDTKQGTLHIKGALLLLLGALLLAVGLLAPFVTYSRTLTPVLGFSSIDGARPGCIAGPDLVAHNQCASWQEPAVLWPLTVLLLLVIIAFGWGATMYATKFLSHKDGRRFANFRFVLALITSAMAFMAYTFARGLGQNNGSYDFGFISATLAPQGSIAHGGPYVPLHEAALGYGLRPAMALLLITGFIVPAFISWHQFMFSHRHIEGQKKKDLFQ